MDENITPSTVETILEEAIVEKSPMELEAERLREIVKIKDAVIEKQKVDLSKKDEEVNRLKAVINANTMTSEPAQEEVMDILSPEELVVALQS